MEAMAARHLGGEEVLGLHVVGRLLPRPPGLDPRLLARLPPERRLRHRVEVEAEARGLVLPLRLEVGREPHGAVGEVEGAQARLRQLRLVVFVGVHLLGVVRERPALQHEVGEGGQIWEMWE